MKAGIGALAVAQIAWMAWFLVVPLPYASNVGTTPKAVRRGLLLLKAFPEVVPDTPFGASFLGKGIEELSHVENLPQRAPIVLAAGLIAAAAIGLGDMTLRRLRLDIGLRLGERIALDYGLGAGLLGTGTLLVGRLGLLNPWMFRLVLGLVAAIGLRAARPWRWPHPRFDTASALLGLVLVPFVLVSLLGSMLPSIDFDVLEYHLQGPKEYFQSGRIAFLPHNVYTNMPFNVEMLHLLGMEVLDDWWWGGLAGQLLVALFAPAAAVLIAGAAERGGSLRAGWIGAVVYLSTPWIYRLAAIAYVEGPLCFYHAALVWTAVRGWTDRSISLRRLWGLFGLLAGCAMGCKYPALISAVIPFGCLSLVACARSRSIAPLLCYIVGWAIVIGPWLIKNVADTGNPVYPLANSLFQGRYWDQAREAQWSSAHGRQPVSASMLGSYLVDVAGRSDFQSPLYVALAPLALFRRGSRRMAIALWGFVAYLFLTWWLLTHRVDRFWLPLLPPLAILSGLGADWVRNRAWSVVLAMVMTTAIVMNLTYISTALAGLNEWTGDLKFLRRDVPRRWNGAMFRLDTELPENARPLLVGQAAVFHLEHRVTYNTVFNPEIIEQLASNKSNQEFAQALHERKLTHIYVDWTEIQRHRKPGGYGFSDFVQPWRFDGWVAAGILDPPSYLGTEQEVYRIR
jgi:hypothetical protein